MKKHIVIVAGILLTLGTAVAATVGPEAPAVKPAATEAAASELVSTDSARIVSLWKGHASSSGSTRLARPL